MQTFQSTPSLRKATPIIMSALRGMAISIHTFLAEGDHFMLHSTRATSYFNPHLPCGRRQLLCRHVNRLIYFNPHLPCGRRHITLIYFLTVYVISIHTFLAEGDQFFPGCCSDTGNFNPHLPCGRRPTSAGVTKQCHSISIHTFLAEGDTASFVAFMSLAPFQSTPSLRKATPPQFGYSGILWYFNPHLPCGRRLRTDPIAM